MTYRTARLRAEGIRIVPFRPALERDNVFCIRLRKTNRKEHSMLRPDQNISPSDGTETSRGNRFPPQQSESEQPGFVVNPTRQVQSVIACSGFFFVLLQSVCTFFTAVSGLRLLIGVSALAAVIRAGQTWDKFHTDLIRIPMITFAFCGAILNLAVLRRIRRLRARPAAQWRLKPSTTRTSRMERAQFVLSIATLILFAVEEATHWKTFHRF